MSVANKRGDTSPLEGNFLHILTEQAEIIENLGKLNRKLIGLLAQHTEVDEYEDELEKILK